MLGADSFPMWKVERHPWNWSLKHFKRSPQVQKYIHAMVHQKYSKYANKEKRAQIIYQIALSALEELKKACDEAPAPEGEASTSSI